MLFDPTLLLTQLQAALAGYGPWGLLAAGAIAVYLRYFRRSSPTPATPATPAPSPAPAPAPATPATPSRPLLDLLLKLLGGKAAAIFPDVSRDEALERMLIQDVSTHLYDERRKRAEAEAKTK